MYDKLLEVLVEIRPDINYEKEKKLVTDELLDSYDIISIVASIMDKFGIEIPIEDINEKNFDSIETLFTLLEKLINNQKNSKKV